MRTVKVRILPPQPNSFPRIAAKLALADLIPIPIPVNFRCFPSTQYLQRAAFAKLGWTVEEIQSDYGIDFDVEVFMLDKLPG